MNEMKKFAKKRTKCCQVIMWLSSEMVDSCFIRAIVCSGQREQKKPRESEMRSTKGRVGEN